MAWVVFAAMYPLYGLLPYVLSSCIGYKDLNLPLTKMVSTSQHMNNYSYAYPDHGKSQ